jgi:hypothetical protein
MKYKFQGIIDDKAALDAVILRSSVTAGGARMGGSTMSGRDIELTISGVEMPAHASSVEMASMDAELDGQESEYAAVMARRDALRDMVLVGGRVVSVELEIEKPAADSCFARELAETVGRGKWVAA